MLKGNNANGGNPRQLEFVTFRKTDPAGTPQNPWAAPYGTPNYDMMLGRYYCKFDTNFDKLINGTGMSGIMDVPENDVRKSVIVWTYRHDPDSNEVLEVIKSWQ